MRIDQIYTSVGLPTNLTNVISKYDYYEHITPIFTDHQGYIQEIKELSNGNIVINRDNRQFMVMDIKTQTAVDVLENGLQIDEYGNECEYMIKMLVLKDDTLITYTDHYKQCILKVWQSVQGKYKQTGELVIYSTPCIDVFQDFLVIGASRLMIWDPYTQKRIAKLKGHELKIFSVKVIEQYRIVSGDEGGIIKIWNPITFENVSTLKMNELGVNNIIPFSDNRLLNIYDDDNTLVMWDWLTGKQLFKMEYTEEDIDNYFGNRNTISCVIRFKEWIVTGSEKGVLTVWDSENGSVYSSVKLQFAIYNLQVLPNNHILIGLDRGEVVSYDMENSHIRYIHNDGDNTFALLVCKNGMIISIV